MLILNSLKLLTYNYHTFFQALINENSNNISETFAKAFVSQLKVSKSVHFNVNTFQQLKQFVNETSLGKSLWIVDYN